MKIDHAGKNNIGIVFLCWENDWRYEICGGGNHRMAALAALDYETVTVQTSVGRASGGFLRFEEARHWPIVVNGYLCESQAKRIFERLFHAKQPPVAHDWQCTSGEGAVRKA